MNLNEETINRNYGTWIECLKNYECLSDSMISDIGEDIKNASWALDSKNGAGKGSMLNVVLKHLCTIAVHINNCAFGENSKGVDKHPLLKVDKKSLMKVLLLQHISKAMIFMPTTEQWKKNKGMVYDFNNELTTSMKLGERSIFLCMKYGINLTEEEYEAMRIIDKDEDKSYGFINPLCEIVKIANQLTAIETYQNNKQNN